MKRGFCLVTVFVVLFSFLPVKGQAAGPGSITISFVGDCTIGYDDSRGYSNSLVHVFDQQNGNFGYFFENVLPIFEEDDLTVANFEGALTNANAKAVKEFTFKAPPHYVNVLTAGSIEMVNLANNHTMDYLQKGYDDTVAALTQAGVTYFGENKSAIVQIKGIDFGFLGYKGWNVNANIRENIKKDIASLKSQGAQVVIVTFHWGVERSNYPNATQKDLGHTAIDAGADLVIGHHPHVLQGIEEYKGKHIVYSLGNFCFGGNRNPDDKDTMIFQQHYELWDGQITGSSISIIPAKVSSENNRNDFKPTPATGDEAQRIVNRLVTFSSSLNQKNIITESIVLYENWTPRAAGIYENTPIIQIEDTLYYPLKDFLETTNGQVVWDSEKRTATASWGRFQVEFSVDTPIYCVDGKEFGRDDKDILLLSGKIYISETMLRKNIGIEPGWNFEKQEYSHYILNDILLSKGA